MAELLDGRVAADADHVHPRGHDLADDRVSELDHVPQQRVFALLDDAFFLGLVEERLDFLLPGLPVLGARPLPPFCSSRTESQRTKARTARSRKERGGRTGGSGEAAVPRPGGGQKAGNDVEENAQTTAEKRKSPSGRVRKAGKIKKAYTARAMIRSSARNSTAIWMSS